MRAARQGVASTKVLQRTEFWRKLLCSPAEEKNHLLRNSFAGHLLGLPSPNPHYRTKTPASTVSLSFSSAMTSYQAPPLYVNAVSVHPPLAYTQPPTGVHQVGTYAQATPHTPSQYEPTATPVVASTPVTPQPVVHAVPVQGIVVQTIQQQPGHNVRHCRRCGRLFELDPKTRPATSAAFNCKKCRGLHLSDFF